MSTLLCRKHQFIYFFFNFMTISHVYVTLQCNHFFIQCVCVYRCVRTSVFVSVCACSSVCFAIDMNIKFQTLCHLTLTLRRILQYVYALLFHMFMKGIYQISIFILSELTELHKLSHTAISCCHLPEPSCHHHPLYPRWCVCARMHIKKSFQL